jgi:hypothetical protein
MATKKHETEAATADEVVVKNLTNHPLAIGGVTIAPGGEAAIDNWDVIKGTAVIVTWRGAGVIAV